MFRKNRVSDMAGADPGFLLGGGALVSCSTSTPINHVCFFFAEYQLYKKTSGHLRGGGGGVAHPLHLPTRSAPVREACEERERLSKALRLPLCVSVMRLILFCTHNFQSACYIRLFYFSPSSASTFASQESSLN